MRQVDQLPAEGRVKVISRIRRRLTATFAQTRFAGCTMVPVAARPGALSAATGEHEDTCSKLSRGAKGIP